MLTTIVVNAESERPRLASVSEIDMRNHLLVLDDLRAASDYETAVQALLHKAQNDKLDFTSYPAWRLYAQSLPSGSAGHLTFMAAFSYSHVLADGTSGLIFHRTLLDTLQRRDRTSFDDDATFKTPTYARPLAPALNRAADFPISSSFLIPPFVNEFFPRWLVRRLGMDFEDKEVWIGAAARPPLPAAGELLPTSLLFKQVPQSDIQRVLVVCRKFRVRLTGLLAVLIAQSLRKALQARGQEYMKFNAMLPIDLRRCMPGHGDVMANYPSGIEEKIVINEASTEAMNEDDWAIARRITEKLASKSATRKDQLMSLLKYISNFREWIIKEATKPSDKSFELSNIGVFDPTMTERSAAPKQDDSAMSSWQVQDVVFSQSALATGATLHVNVGSAMNGPLSITMTWWPGMLGVQDEEVFVGEVLGDVVLRLESIK
ncbi:Alcohol acetyltransferase [Recurvomyces mirabilis]|uniref:Alcohol acetyltransferase n=1 Tax=Recurvomyces mirabilis TaxID=574656 RepID=A0AAE0WNP2_9PEZI|nr:Alcohol acetyltransferase [Recurvomyces mirabilis]KAK5158326.1 Alcohol acetyltransferase [Recurvomyces mirabilis]